MSAVDASSRSLAPDSVRQRYKAKFPASGRSRRPAIDPKQAVKLLTPELSHAVKGRWLESMVMFHPRAPEGP